MGIYYVAGMPYSDELYHHGIVGMKWGIRRYQNKDGSLTAEGRKHYGVHGSVKNKVYAYANSAKSQIGKAAKKTGATVGKAANATAKYVGKRFKMNHPSLMSDQELKEYTQRLIAEKNYSQMMSQYESPSVAGRASNLVKNLAKDAAGVPFSVVRGLGEVSGDILKKGANTLADAGFRKLASEMTKTKLERENDRLSNAVKNKELREKLEPKSKDGALARAMAIINSPNSTASDVQEAKNILQNYSASKNFIANILKSSNNTAAAAAVADSIGVDLPASSAQASNSSQSAPATRSGYAPAEWNRFANWNMRSMESMNDSYRPSYRAPTSSEAPVAGNNRGLVDTLGPDIDSIQRAILRPANRPDNLSWVEQLDLNDRRNDILRRR